MKRVSDGSWAQIGDGFGAGSGTLAGQGFGQGTDPYGRLSGGVGGGEGEGGVAPYWLEYYYDDSERD